MNLAPECRADEAFFARWVKHPRKGWTLVGYYRARIDAERAVWAAGCGIALPRDVTPHSLGLGTGRAA